MLERPGRFVGAKINRYSCGIGTLIIKSTAESIPACVQGSNLLVLDSIVALVFRKEVADE